MALPPTRRRNPRSLTASAVRMGANTGSTTYQRRWSLPWQERGLTYMDTIPEISYASLFYSRMLKQLRLFPARLDEHGTKIPIETGPPVDVLNRVQDPGGGRSKILSSYGKLMLVTGEGYLFGHSLGSDEEKWQFVWTQELYIADGMIIWRPYENMAEPQEFVNGQTAVAYRFWTPHPRRSGEAWSPLRSAIEGGICEELLILTAAVRSTAVSRMTNGMLWFPQEITPGPINAIGDEDPENDPLMTDLIEHVTAQVENPGSAEAAVPFIGWANGEYLEQIRFISTHDPQTDYMEKDLRKEAVERIAVGADMPPEVLTGLGSTNHWAAKQIKDDMWQSHGVPIAEQFVDDLAEAYLQPALRDENYDGWESVVVDYDPSLILVNPDRAKNAVEAHDRIIISDASARREMNYKESDAPDDEERKRREALKVRDAQELFGSDTGERGPAKQDSQPDTNPSDGPPEPGPNGVSRQDGMSARVMGAAELAVVRCRELAGAKLRRLDREGKLPDCVDCLEAADGEPNAFVAPLIGIEALAAFRNVTPKWLVRGGTDSFKLLLQSYDVEPLTIDLLCSVIEAHAAKTLTMSQPGIPDEFVKVVTNGALAH